MIVDLKPNPVSLMASSAPMKETKNNRRWLPETPGLLALLATGAIASVILVIGLARTSNDSNNTSSFLCSLSGFRSSRLESAADFATTPTQLLAVLHYATSRVVPQQSLAEIRVSFDTLRSLGPCNFLVFGLGHDSLMWDSLNPRGSTLFLEEDPKWIQNVLQRAPVLRASAVRYHTRLSQAKELLSSYKSEPDCSPANARLRDTRCRLALTELPAEVYEQEWDMIMIDAPRGYFPEAPGRMAAIFSAAVMARARTRPGVTNVFLHDINRKVERTYAKEFLCMKYKVNAVGRLWHFQIPPASNATHNTNTFC